MGDWLHCNTCFRQPGDGRSYFLTSCGHIYCEPCGTKGWKQNCMMCGTENPNSVKLTAKTMPPPVDVFISDPMKIMEKIRSQLKQLIAVSEFQHSQRKRFISWLQKSVSNQRQIVDQQEKELISTFNKRFEEIERENSKLKEEHNYLKSIISSKRDGMSIRSPLTSDNRGYVSPAAMTRYNAG